MQQPIRFHLFRAPFMVERGNGKPGYSWKVAWIRALPGGASSQAMTRSEWAAASKVENARRVWHCSELQARAAADGKIGYEDPAQTTRTTLAT